MDVNGYISPTKVFKTSSMVKMQVADDHRFHILDVVPGLGDSGGELMFRLVVYAREDVVDRRTPDVGVIFAGSGLKEDEAFGRVVDEDGDHSEFTALVFGVPTAADASIAAANYPAHVDFEVTKIEKLGKSVWGIG